LNKIHIKAPAKINFGLNITGKRLDGFHNLITLFYPLHDLFDELTFTKSDIDIFQYDDSIKDLSDDNLILKAKQLIEELIDKSLPTEIVLSKNIPIGAGLGGGSSDAAATLISINELYQLNIDYTTLTNLALELGSDVPFFLRAKPAIGKSRGEILTQVDFFINFPIVVVNPGIHVSTKAVFGKLTEYSPLENLNLRNPSSIDSIKDFNNVFSNDFEKIVFDIHPQIKEIKDSLTNSNALYASMTGTGSTVYGIFKDKNDAVKAITNLPNNYFKQICLPQLELM
jgi:4-diphosphocytidyl-2-C-methyl-D-erythritol kinase